MTCRVGFAECDGCSDLCQDCTFESCFHGPCKKCYSNCWPQCDSNCFTCEGWSNCLSEFCSLSCMACGCCNDDIQCQCCSQPCFRFFGCLSLCKCMCCGCSCNAYKANVSGYDFDDIDEEVTAPPNKSVAKTADDPPR